MTTKAIRPKLRRWGLPGERTIGIGTLDRPVIRVGGLCAVRDCTRYGRIRRITEAGHVVAYCDACVEEAVRLFG